MGDDQHEPFNNTLLASKAPMATVERCKVVVRRLPPSLQVGSGA